MAKEQQEVKKKVEFTADDAKLPDPINLEEITDKDEPLKTHLRLLKKLTITAEEAEKKRQKAIDGFLARLTPMQARMIKAVVTDDAAHLKPSAPDSLEQALTRDDILTFARQAESDASGLIGLEKKMLGQVPRGEESHPETYLWEGPRAVMLIATTDVNARVNKIFGTRLPVAKHLTSQAALRKYHLERARQRQREQK